MLAAKTRSPQARPPASAEAAKDSARPQKAPLPNPTWARVALGAQAKLAVGTPDDRYEREADLTADRVLTGEPVQAISRLPALGLPQGQTRPTNVATARPPALQRDAARDDEDDALQRMPAQPETDEEREEPIQARAETGDASINPDAAERAMARGGSGSSLPSALRRRMEDGIGADFSAVRVHTGAAANDAARALNARAFTRGGDIYLARGEDRSDPRLMGHELAHVVQQGAADRVGGRSTASPKVASAAIAQRWEGIEHKTVGNRAQNRFPFRGTISINMTALRSTAKKDPGAPYDNIEADLLKGVEVLALGEERGWIRVLVESGDAKDKTGKTVSAEKMTGYVSHELIKASGAVFDAELPMGGGLDLSYGDLVAFGGDHFKDLGQIVGEASTAAGRARLKKLRDLIDSEGTKSPAYEEAATISKEYAERYKNLALENVSHFLHGGTALATWQTMHREAIVAAFDAGRKGDSAGLANAYALNAFADHFLTDSFSAGHVRVPRAQLIRFYEKLANDVFGHIIDHLANRLGSRIYDLLEQDYARVRQFGDASDRADARVRTQITTAIAAAGGQAKLQQQFGLYVAGAFSKILHDRENAAGLPVVSKRYPKGWTAYGDANLGLPGNADNVAHMQEAVQASKQDVLDAFNLGLGVFTEHGKTAPKSAIDAAMDALKKKVGPPYVALEFVPSPAATAKPLPSGEWGQLDPTVRAELLALISKYLTTTVQNELLLQFPVTQEIEITGPNVDARPRDAARDILNEFLADPVTFLEQAFGRQASP